MRLALDFDGTVADSMGTLEELAVTCVLERAVLMQTVIRDRYRVSAGDPFERQIEHINPGFPGNAAIAADFATRKREVTLLARPFDDAVVLLDRCVELDVDVFLVTSTVDDLVHEWLDAWEQRRYGLYVLGRDHGTKLENLTELRPDLFVGDTYRDEVYGELAEVRTIGLSRDEDLLPWRFGRIHTLTELLEELERGTRAHAS